MVLALSFLLLLLAFRSVLVPLKAVIMNLLSIAAAFGVVTYVFGHHWSATLVGLEATVPIVSFVPLMMFAILFGLSMDYEVFLMSHVREAYQETGDPHEAVVDGLATTGRVITSAALIMVSRVLRLPPQRRPEHQAVRRSGWRRRWRSTPRSSGACSCPRS